MVSLRLDKRLQHSEGAPIGGHSPSPDSVYWPLGTPDGRRMALTSFDIGKLKIIGHVREELDRVDVVAESIRCIAGGIETPPGIARLTITLNGASASLDLEAHEVE